MTDKEFREEYKPLQVPAHFDKTASIADQTLYALGQLGSATADEVAGELMNLHSDEAGKDLIGGVHLILTEWHTKGLIAATDENGDLHYSLQKITEANDGHVNPDLLAPGLD
ncbi:hypothetical protein ACFQZS_07410 [Mucilaginibacter calamicampi]|uniref:Uncharacterized protein n=1 Tax=Mucilaginibacter calamicampi TaxID=1302352 RepID=A0ABW2YU64_9SPHI